MPRQLLVLEEVIAMMRVVGVLDKYIDKFRTQAESVLKHKDRKEFDNVTVSSGFGHQSQRGFVELAIEDTLTQMDAKKAQEIGLMLLQASEAAQSDEIFMGLLSRHGVLDIEQRGRMLLELRELRQGTKGVSYPS